MWTRAIWKNMKITDNYYIIVVDKNNHNQWHVQWFAPLVLGRNQPFRKEKEHHEVPVPTLSGHDITK